jgi:hypothetical protein
MRTIMKAIAVVLAILAIPSCRIFQAEKYEQRDKCAKTIPILEEKPTAHYQILKAISGKDDEQLRYRACVVYADAVVRAGIGTSYSGWTWSSTTMLQGLAIKWEKANQETETP